MHPTATRTNEPTSSLAGDGRTPPRFSPTGELETRPERRGTGRVTWLGIAAAFVAATALLVAGISDSEVEHANQAATARLQAEADAHEAMRVARADHAAAARLQAQADRIGR